MTMTPTLENLEQTLADIKQIDPASGRNIMTEYEDFINQFQLTVMAKSVSTLLEKAKKYYFNERKVLEMNVLFSAYCKIKASNLSSEDLRATKLTDYTTGIVLTPEAEGQRLAALGCKG